MNSLRFIIVKAVDNTTPIWVHTDTIVFVEMKPGGCAIVLKDGTVILSIHTADQVERSLRALKDFGGFLQVAHTYN
jgi:hypothetical protein